MSYATHYINSVEYGSGYPKSQYYSWSKADRTKFTEKQLAEALNRAYVAGVHDAAQQMKELAIELRSRKQ